MKKIVLSLVLMAGVFGIVQADENDGVRGGYGGRKIWISSFTQANEARPMLISTGNIIIGFINVIGTGTFCGVTFQECTSTAGGDTSGFRLYGSSFPAITSAARPAYFSGYQTSAYVQPPGIEIMKTSTMGFAVYQSTFGLPQPAFPSLIEIKWDYVSPRR